MLSTLVKGKHPNSLIIIQDSREQCGINLLKAFAQQAINFKDNHVHIICYEHPVSKLRNELRNIGEDHVHFHDCFNDHRGWFAKMNVESVQSDENMQDIGILSVLKSLPSTEVHGCIVIIDSFTSLLFNLHFSRCYHDLHSLLNKCVRSYFAGIHVSYMVLLLHEDTLPNRHIVLSQLQHLATSYFIVGSPIHISNNKPIVNMIHKKQGGKVVTQVECYSVDVQNMVTSENLLQLPPPVIKSSDTVEGNDLPLNLTTFKLSLGVQEKQARSELDLPYVRMNKQKGGKVFYHPDAADDWDEEDPDDDLNV